MLDELNTQLDAIMSEYIKGINDRLDREIINQIEEELKRDGFRLVEINDENIKKQFYFNLVTINRLKKDYTKLDIKYKKALKIINNMPRCIRDIECPSFEGKTCEDCINEYIEKECGFSK